MKHTFTLFATFFLISFTFGQTKNEQTKSAINIGDKTGETEESLGLKETEYDFRKIPQGKPVTHIFEVVNNGKGPLKISNVIASCGCTTPEWERNKSIEPGGGTTIKVGYNAASSGSFTKTVTISYNDVQTKVITIKGEVWPTPITSAPENKSLADFKN